MGVVCEIRYDVNRQWCVLRERDVPRRTSPRVRPPSWRVAAMDPHAQRQKKSNIWRGTILFSGSGRAFLFGRCVVALPCHNMSPKKRKQADAAADELGDVDTKPDVEIDRVKQTIELISHLTRDELTLVNEACRRRVDHLALLATYDFDPGDTVTWNKDKNGIRMITGTVTKVNSMSVAVTSHSPKASKWKLSATLLTKTEKRQRLLLEET